MRRLTERRLMIFCCITCMCLVVEAIDCRRFVFAPRCRGVSAKRSTLKLKNEELRDDAEDTLLDISRLSSDDFVDSSFDNKRRAVLQKLLEKFDYSLRDEDN